MHPNVSQCIMIRYTVAISPGAQVLEILAISGRQGAQTISLTIPRPEVLLPPSVWQQRILQTWLDGKIPLEIYSWEHRTGLSGG